VHELGESIARQLAKPARGIIPYRGHHARFINGDWLGGRNPCCFYPPFTESQNHRIVALGRDVCGLSSTTPLPNQGQLEQVAQDLFQVG